MKNFKLLLAALVAVVSISSCMKDDNNYDGPSWEEEQARIDSVLDKQKSIVEAYAREHLSEEKIMKNDSLGIWYEVLPSTVDSTFEYVQSGNSFMTVSASVKYSEKGITGDYSKEVTTATRASILQGYVPTAWLVAFYPDNINGKYYPGLLGKGLLKGSKIRVIAPSPYYYDNNEVKDADGNVLPANTPVDFTIEVIDISR